MIKLFMAGLVSVALFVAVAYQRQAAFTNINSHKVLIETYGPKASNDLETYINEDDNSVKVLKVLVLEKTNIVTLRGPVTTSSVGSLMLELQKLSRKLPASKPIFLVLDTPGGSVSDGIDLINFMKALPQKVHTITLFGASMGFHIAQNLGTRYIDSGGTLMSHRAALGGLSGQIKGELESRYKMIRKMIDYLDYKAAIRMGTTLEDYEEMIINEYWTHGFEAVSDKAADEEVLIRCGSSLTGNTDVTFSTMFGKITATFSDCPLIKYPMAINFSDLGPQKERVEKSFLLSIFNKEKFVTDFIVTGKFYEIY